MRVYVVYGNDYSDADIIEVSATNALNIESLGQQFCDWLAADKTHTFRGVTEHGMSYLICETTGFIWWLNKFHNEGEEAVILEEHIVCDYSLPVVEF